LEDGHRKAKRTKESKVNKELFVDFTNEKGFIKVMQDGRRIYCFMWHNDT